MLLRKHLTGITNTFCPETQSVLYYKLGNNLRNSVEGKCSIAKSLKSLVNVKNKESWVPEITLCNVCYLLPSILVAYWLQLNMRHHQKEKRRVHSAKLICTNKVLFRKVSSRKGQTRGRVHQTGERYLSAACRASQTLVAV